MPNPTSPAIHPEAARLREQIYPFVSELINPWKHVDEIIALVSEACRKAERYGRRHGYNQGWTARDRSKVPRTICTVCQQISSDLQSTTERVNDETK